MRAILDHSRRLMAAGKLEEARLYLEFHTSNGTPDFALLLAHAGLEKTVGNFEKSAEILESILAKDPVNTTALEYRVSLALSTQDSVALAKYAPCLQIHSNGRSSAVFMAGIGFFEIGNYALAARLFAQLKCSIGDSPEVDYYRGRCFRRMGRFLDAEEALRTSLLAQNNCEVGIELAGVLADLRCPNEVISVCQKLLESEDCNPAVFTLMAKALSLEGRESEADEYWGLAESTADDVSTILKAKGFHLWSIGSFEKASSILESAIDQSPKDGQAYCLLTKTRRVTFRDAARIEAAIYHASDPGLAKSSRQHFHFALGKSYHDLDCHYLAAHHYERANQLLRQSRMNGVPYDPAPIKAAVDAQIAQFDFVRNRRELNVSESTMPIFIVGMIRSGTTLVEAILSRHSKVVGGGEMQFWPASFRSAVDLDTGEIDAGELKHLVTRYLQLVSHFGKGSPHVTDKNPANFMSCGLLHYAFPKAKIVCLRRRPIDIALSIWRTDAVTDATFQGDKLGIVHAIKESNRMMDFWAKNLPKESFHEITYDDLVSEPDRTVRTLLKFLQIPWEKECLEHHGSDREIFTPSAWQARQPIYSSSRNAWKRYRPWLGEFESLIQPELLC